MNKLTTKILAISLAAVAVCAFVGCDQGSSSSDTSSNDTAQTTAQTSTDESFNIKNLHSYDIENGDEFAGVWTITDGTGSQLESFSYLFDGSGTANLITGTSGYCGTYEISDGEFTCQLMFGINGTYTYTATDSTITLTNTETEETTTISRVASFDIIPQPIENFSIDNDLLGAWESTTGEFYYFDENGVMYQNQYQTMYTYYAYSASDGKLSCVSYIGEEKNEDSYDYTVNGDTLTIDSFEYTKISTDDLK
jgi:hypothetical protein